MRGGGGARGRRDGDDMELFILVMVQGGQDGGADTMQRGDSTRGRGDGDGIGADGGGGVGGGLKPKKNEDDRCKEGNIHS